LTTEGTDITENKTSFLCVLCALGGENAFDPGVKDRAASDAPTARTDHLQIVTETRYSFPFCV